MMLISDIATIFPTKKRSCADCSHCRVSGLDEWGDALCYCAKALWDVTSKTVRGVAHTKIDCEYFEDAGEE